MSNIDSFLKLVKSDQDLVSVWIPSKSAEYKFKPITVSQQKLIIKDTLSGVNGQLLMQKTFNDIIEDNYFDEEDYAFTMLDRSAILSQLRSAYLGSGATDTTGKVAILVDPREVKTSLHSTTERITSNGITVTVEIPTLKRDSNFITLLTSSKTFTNPGDLVNDLYITELAKFITRVEFNEVNFEPTISETLRLVNELPTKLITQIMKFIKQVKDIDNQYLISASGTQIQLNTQFFNDPV